MKLDDILLSIVMERADQDRKFGYQDHVPELWAVILGEEYGEVCRAICDGKPDGYVNEIVQVAAVCVNMIQSYYKNQERDNYIFKSRFSSTIKGGQ